MRTAQIWVAGLLMAGCAAPATPTSRSSTSDSAQPGAPPSSSTPKKVTLGILYEPVDMADGRTRPFKDLMAAGFSAEDETGVRHPQLAEAVPTVENGLWKLFPDGRMETTFRLRENLRWHDGEPFTMDDILFTTTVLLDKDLPEAARLRDSTFDLIEGVSAADARTVVVRWREPYVNADAMFSTRGFVFAVPQPRHLLETHYRESHDTYFSNPFFTTQYMGTGPFRLREFERGSHVLMEAFRDYALGRPKIDVVEVKIITDPNVMLANVLAGAVDLTGRQGVSMDQAVTVRESWQAGTIKTLQTGWTMMYPQFQSPGTVLLLNPQFRRALVYSIDRQEIADTIGGGFSPIAHSVIPPDEPEYAAIESSIVRYEFDPRRAVRLLDELGLARGPDGMYRDGASQRLAVEVRATSSDANTKAMLAVADAFTRIGVTGDPMSIPRQGVTPEWEVSFPGYRLANQDSGITGISNLLDSSAAPLPERGFKAPDWPKNRGSYVDADYDAIMRRFNSTILRTERIAVMRDLVRLQTDLQLVTGLYYTVAAVMVNNRLRNVPPGTAWNAHEWDVAG